MSRREFRNFTWNNRINILTNDYRDDTVYYLACNFENSELECIGKIINNASGFFFENEERFEYIEHKEFVYFVTIYNTLAGVQMEVRKLYQVNQEEYKLEKRVYENIQAPHDDEHQDNYILFTKDNILHVYFPELNNLFLMNLQDEEVKLKQYPVNFNLTVVRGFFTYCYYNQHIYIITSKMIYTIDGTDTANMKLESKQKIKVELNFRGVNLRQIPLNGKLYFLEESTNSFYQIDLETKEIIRTVTLDFYNIQGFCVTTTNEIRAFKAQDYSGKHYFMEMNFESNLFDTFSSL